MTESNELQENDMVNRIQSNHASLDQSSEGQSSEGQSSEGQSSKNLIDLNSLSQLTPIYQKLMSGFHITENNLSLWQSLDQELFAYQTLFKGLGYELIKDARGYFYFSTPDTTVTMTKTSRRIALLIYTLIEHWADNGLDPVASLFEQALTKETLQKLFDQNLSIFQQIDITNASDIKTEILKRMVRLGFAKELGKEFKLLPSCYRYIDAVLELSPTDDTVDSHLTIQPESQADPLSKKEGDA